MIKGLNLPAIAEALPRAGLSQATLAKELGVSREAVSKWFKGTAIPKPDKLLDFGMLLGMSFEQLVEVQPASAVPIVFFRKKAGRRTKDAHLNEARDIGELLKRLVPLLPERPLSSPSVLSEPRMDYAYVQKAAEEVRKEMRLLNNSVIQYPDLIDKFARLHAVIVPVMWGERQNHGNALNIHLSESHITWVFLNLDSNIIDFKFWIAHELGHALAPKLLGEEGEDFADAFAQALLFPQKRVTEFRLELRKHSTVQARISLVKQEAEERGISLLTIRRALEDFEEAAGLEITDLGSDRQFMAMMTNFAKSHAIVSEQLFERKAAKPQNYIRVCEDAFKTPFFKALKTYCRENECGANYIHRILSLPLIDAKALAEELTA